MGRLRLYTNSLTKLPFGLNCFSSFAESNSKPVVVTSVVWPLSDSLIKFCFGIGIIFLIIKGHSFIKPMFRYVCRIKLCLLGLLGLLGSLRSLGLFGLGRFRRPDKAN